MGLTRGKRIDQGWTTGCLSLGIILAIVSGFCGAAGASALALVFMSVSSILLLIAFFGILVLIYRRLGDMQDGMQELKDVNDRAGQIHRQLGDILDGIREPKGVPQIGEQDAEPESSPPI
jgi:hypothetical protein